MLKSLQSKCLNVLSFVSRKVKIPKGHKNGIGQPGIWPLHHDLPDQPETHTATRDRLSSCCHCTFTVTAEPSYYKYILYTYPKSHITHNTFLCNFCATFVHILYILTHLGPNLWTFFAHFYPFFSHHSGNLMFAFL